MNKRILAIGLAAHLSALGCTPAPTSAPVNPPPSATNAPEPAADDTDAEPSATTTLLERDAESNDHAAAETPRDALPAENPPSGQIAPLDLSSIGTFLTIDVPPGTVVEWASKGFALRWSDESALVFEPGTIDLAARLEKLQADKNRPVMSILRQTDSELVVEIKADDGLTYWFEGNVGQGDDAYHFAPKDSWRRYSKPEALAMLAIAQTLRATDDNRRVQQAAADAAKALGTAGVFLDRSGADFYASFSFDTPVNDQLMAECEKLPQLTWVTLGNLRNLQEKSLNRLAAIPALRRLDIESSPLTDAGLESIGKLVNLRVLSIKHTAITGDGLHYLADLNRLENLDLDGNELSDAGLADLGPMPRLKYLSLCETPIGDPGLAAIGKYSGVKHLLLRNTQVVGPGLAHLAAMDQLSWLDLNDSTLDDTSLAHIGKLPHLEHLRLAGTRIAGPGLRNLQSLKSLHELVLSRTKINGSGLAGLAGLPMLAMLELEDMPLTDEDLVELHELANLRTLYLRRTKITGGSFGQLKHLPELRMLLIGENQLTDESMGALASLPALSSLYVSDTPIGDPGLELLAKCPKLKDVDLTHTSATAAGVEKFRQAKPDCDVRFPKN